jgi:hypothetical protein
MTMYLVKNQVTQLYIGGGGSVAEQQNSRFISINKGYRKKSKQNAKGCLFVGFGDSLRGEKGERAKIIVLQTFPPTLAF